MTPYGGRSVEAAADIVSTWETSGKGYGDLEERIAAALCAAYNEGAGMIAAPTCPHDWTKRGGPGDEWRECFLCGLQEDA